MRKTVLISLALVFLCQINSARGEERSRILSKPVVLDSCLVGAGTDARKLLLTAQELPPLPVAEVVNAVENPSHSNTRPGNTVFALIMSRPDDSGAKLLWIEYAAVGRGVMPAPVISGVIAKAPISNEICVVVCVSHGFSASVIIARPDVSKPMGDYPLDFLGEKDYGKWPRFDGKCFRPKAIEVTRGGTISWVRAICEGKQFFVCTGGDNMRGNEEPLRLWEFDATTGILTPIQVK